MTVAVVSCFIVNRWRRLLAVIALLGLLAVSHPAPFAVADGGVSPCRSDQLRLTIQTQGENTTARIDATIRNLARRCTITAVVRLTITRYGKRAAVSGNPLSHRFQGVLRNGRAIVMRADWMNWCGGRQGLRVHATLDGKFARAAFHTLPLCLQPTDSSRLLLIK